MPEIVIVEDDWMIAEPVIRSLEKLDYKVHHEFSGRNGTDLILQLQPDLVILDIMLPEMDGWEVCKTVREKSVVPILMLTALSDEVDRILGLEIGADDYLTKPFSNRELIARIKAMLRRVEFDQSLSVTKHLLQSGDIQIDVKRRHLEKCGKSVSLRYKEFELLVLLASRMGEIVTRAEIFDKVWGTEWLGDMRTLDVHIRWLREKIEDDPGDPKYIQTIRGVGYSFLRI